MRLAFPLLLSALLLCSCQQQVHTWSLPTALEYLDTPNSMSRGVDYLGSDADFHYFEHDIEMGSNVRFRISACEYTPVSQAPYRSWFPHRRQASQELGRLSLAIHSHYQDAGFTYWYMGKEFQNPAELPAESWQHIRCIHLPAKSVDINQAAKDAIRPYLPDFPKLHFIAPVSGLPAHMLDMQGAGHGHGGITNDALDELIRNRS